VITTLKAAKSWCLVSCTLAVLLLPGCTIRRGIDRPDEQPFDVVYSMPVRGPVGLARNYRLPNHAHGWVIWRRGKPSYGGASGTYDLVDPIVRNWIRTRPLTEKVEVLVTLQDSLPLPRLPNIDPRLPLSAPENVQAIAIGRHMTDSVFAWRRANEYWKDTSAVLAVGATRIKETFWITRAMVVEIPVGKIDQIRNLPEVERIEPVGLLSRPPCPTPIESGNATIRTARDLLGTDIYTVHASGGALALLDTGVDTGHQTFATVASLIHEMRDCVNDPDCNGTIVGDDCEGHGTKSASILIGGGAGNDNFSGVLSAPLNSFRVWKKAQGGDCSLYTRKNWVADGLEIAAHGASTVVIQVDETYSDLSFMAKAADNAYDLGASVIVAAGNDSSYGPTTPGNARRVIAVGAHDLETNDVIPTLSHGRTADGRIKPDVLAPSGAEAATNSACDWVGFGFTSGAAPFGGAVALIARNWLIAAANTPTIDPGQVYAFMIMCGNRPIHDPDGGLDTFRGAGLMKLPGGGLIWFGKVLIYPGTHADIPITIPSYGGSLDAALWWPQKLKITSHKRVDTHNDLDLELRSPSGVLKAKSADGPGVFQRASVVAAGQGEWMLKIIAGSFCSTEPQVVYWCASVPDPSNPSVTPSPGPSTSPLPSPSP
jgi:hypothetical protein